MTYTRYVTMLILLLLLSALGLGLLSAYAVDIVTTAKHSGARSALEAADNRHFWVPVVTTAGLFALVCLMLLKRHQIVKED